MGAFVTVLSSARRLLLLKGGASPFKRAANSEVVTGEYRVRQTAIFASYPATGPARGQFAGNGANGCVDHRSAAPPRSRRGAIGPTRTAVRISQPEYRGIDFERRRWINFAQSSQGG